MPNGNKPFWEIWGILTRGDRDFWTRIGVAFENNDGSYNIKLDYLPTNKDTSLHMRLPKDKDK
jgi:hypothetical protein